MTEAGQRELRDWLDRGFGLDAETFGPGALAAASRARELATGLARAGDYLELWRRDEEERQALLERLLVGETWFFRERGAFDALREQALAARLAGRPSRVLCLPCARGEEAWSIAITLHGAGIGSAGLITAVDLSRPALDTARLGRYGPRALRGLALENWPEYLVPDGPGRFRVADAPRGMVEFFRGNALDAGWLRERGPFEAIFCRNMMIYMSAAGRVRLCRFLAEILAEDGLLFLGHAETPPAEAGFGHHGASGAFAWRRVPDSLPAMGQQRISEPPRGFRHPIPPAPLLQSQAIAPENRLESHLPSEEGRSAGVRAARELADRGAYQEAMRLLESELAKSPLDPDLHALLGILHDIQGQRDQAATHVRRALYLAPGHAESLAHLALLQERRGNPAEAERLRQRLRQSGSIPP